MKANKKTHVINLFAGSGAGKSSLSAKLFSDMKSNGYHVELVTEYAKEKAWRGEKIGPYDQIKITGIQSSREANLYHKLDYVITDSPLLLGPIYELYYTKNSLMLDAVNKLMTKAEVNGVVYHNFFLKRQKKFDKRGRFETEAQANEVDKLILNKLKKWDINFESICGTDANKILSIKNYLKLK